MIYIIVETFSDGTSNNMGYTTNYEEAVTIVKQFRERNHLRNRNNIYTLCVEELTKLSK